MHKKSQALAASLALIGLSCALPAAAKGRNSGAPKKEFTQAEESKLWRSPADISARNLFYGPGGKEDAPRSTFTFVKEDLDGTNPKFVVRDDNGVKWKVKMGVEVRPETAAARLVWAVGYSVNEDYFLPEIRVQSLPSHLKRGQKFVGPGGLVRNVRLKRYLKDEKKIDDWKWRQNPFVGTRELNGLRVMMALINNWDLKDINNSVYTQKSQQNSETDERIFMVSDLGASFGTTGRSWTHAMSKGNLPAYRNSKFINKATPQYVDFNIPTRPAMIWIFTPKEFLDRLRLRWIGRGIPRADVEWIGKMLAQLSPGQIQDAFRGAGYPPAEVEGFSSVVEKRISEINNLSQR